MTTMTRKDPRTGAHATGAAPSHGSRWLAGQAHGTKTSNGEDHVDHSCRAESRTDPFDLPDTDLLYALTEELDR